MRLSKKYSTLLHWIDNKEALQNYTLCQSLDGEGKKLAYLLELNNAINSDKNTLIIHLDSKKNKIIVNYDEYKRLVEENKRLKEGSFENGSK